MKAAFSCRIELQDGCVLHSTSHSTSHTTQVVCRLSYAMNTLCWNSCCIVLCSLARKGSASLLSCGHLCESQISLHQGMQIISDVAPHCAVDEMLVKISSLVGANPVWHTGDPLTISFKKVAAVETVRALWDKVWIHPSNFCCLLLIGLPYKASLRKAALVYKLLTARPYSIIVSAL